MKLEDQVCSFAQGMRLDDLGLQTNSLFGWHQEASDLKETLVLYIGDRRDASKYGWHYIFPAYTVAELGILLQPYTVARNVDKGKIYWRLLDDYYLPKWESKAPLFYKDTEAEGRAEALIWLIENGYVKVERLKP
jgi:hypothetical protein